MMDKNKAVKFLLEKGLLFEINRSILHPLGLALAVSIDSNGEFEVDGLWDARDDEDGMTFEDDVLTEGTTKYAEYLNQEGFDRFNARYEKFGFVRQEKHDREIVLKKSQEFKEKLFGKDPEIKEKDVEEKSSEEIKKDESK